MCHGSWWQEVMAHVLIPAMSVVPFLLWIVKGRNKGA
jgi:hypothetical protein